MPLTRNRYWILGAGILLGIVYGLIARLAFGESGTLASITYLFVTPAALGAIPLMIVSDDALRSYRWLVFIPAITLLGLFATFAALRVEGLMCLVILAAPFVLAATIGAFLFRLVRLYRRTRNGLAAIIVVGPFLLAPSERLINSPTEIYEVAREVAVRAPADVIWNQVIRVESIRPHEYAAGAFQWLGIPRPIEAALSGEGLGAARTGRFEGGLRLSERITEWTPYQRVAFSITVEPESIRPVVFDQHVLTGNYFRFIDAAYEIVPAGGTVRTLRLISRYELTSNLNFYGRWWGDAILRDFQDRLLQVIKQRSESLALRSDAAPRSACCASSSSRETEERVRRSGGDSGAAPDH